MSQGDVPVTMAGNMVADPELRYTPNGVPVASFRVASTPRKYNAQTSQWEEGDALFLQCNVWRQAAENVAESLTKGMRVIVSGQLRQRSYETREGEKRTVMELEVDEVGPSLRYASAAVSRNESGSASHSGFGPSASSVGGFGVRSQGGDVWSNAAADQPPY